MSLARILKCAWISAILLTASGTAFVSPALAEADPLPSWNDTSPKAAILEFVRKVTEAGSPSFVPVPERVAVFDNDGTLSVEQPFPAQLGFELDCVHMAAFKHPDWSTAQPFKAALERDVKALAQGGEKTFTDIMVATHAGWATDDYETTLSAWIANTRDARYDRLYTELVYQPMLELISYLRANDFQVFIVTDGEIEFTRHWSEAVFGVPPDHIAGWSIKTEFKVVNGKPVLIRLPEANFVFDKAGRANSLYAQIGRRPIAAFGNSDADIEMLQWVTMAKGPRLGMIVHHTDAEREYSYDRGEGFGRLAEALDVAIANGWTVIDMKNDWKAIFPGEH